MQGSAAAAWPAGTLRAGVQAQVWLWGCSLGWDCCSPLPAPGRAAATVVTPLFVTVCGSLQAAVASSKKWLRWAGFVLRYPAVLFTHSSSHFFRIGPD